MLNSSPLSRFLNSRILFDADTGGNSAGGEQSDKSQSQTQSVADAVKAALADILGAKGGDKDAALETLIRKNHKLEQRAEAAEAKAGQLPADVQAELEAYRALGKPADVKTAIETGTAAQQKAAALEQEKVLGDAAGVLKLQGNALFKSLLKDVPLKIEGDGEARKVLVTAADGRAVDFEEYAKTRPELMDALPMLQANGQQQNNGQQGGTRWAGGSASGGVTVAPMSFEEQKRRKQAASEYPVF